MHDDNAGNVEVSIERSDFTIGVIVFGVFLSLCLLSLCLRRGRRGVNLEISENPYPISFNPRKEGEDSVQISPSAKLCGHGITLTACRSTEEDSSQVDVDLSQSYGQMGVKSILEGVDHGVDGEEGKLRIQAILKHIEDLPVDLLKSMIIEDLTSDSNMITSDEKGDDSTVLVVLDGQKVIMKYPSCEVVSISGTSWIDSYSPMNKEQKGKYEESHTPGAISNRSMKSVKPLQSQSRTLNPFPKTRTIINISESIVPISLDSPNPIVNVLDGVCSEDEEEDKHSYLPQVSIESIVLSNKGPTLPHVIHKSYLDIPNSSSKTKRQYKISRIISKNSPSEKKIKIVSEAEESLSNYPQMQARGERVDSRSINKDSMKSLTKNASKSQKRSMRDIEIIYDTRPTETNHCVCNPVNSQIWSLEESNYESICLKSLSKD